MQRVLARKGFRVDFDISDEAEAVLQRLRDGQEPLVIACSGHYGAWEVAGAEVARLAAPSRAVASVRVAKQVAFVDGVDRLRSSYGIDSVGTDHVLRHLIKGLQQQDPRLYMFLIDQHYKGGVRLPFLGRPACTVPIPAKLAVKYNAPMLFCTCQRGSGGSYAVHIEVVPIPAAADEEERVLRTSERLNELLGQCVRSVPEQWAWGHRRWRKCCDWVPPGTPAVVDEGAAAHSDQHARETIPYA